MRSTNRQADTLSDNDNKACGGLRTPCVDQREQATGRPSLRRRRLVRTIASQQAQRPHRCLAAIERQVRLERQRRERLVRYRIKAISLAGNQVPAAGEVVNPILERVVAVPGYVRAVDGGRCARCG